MKQDQIHINIDIWSQGDLPFKQGYTKFKSIPKDKRSEINLKNINQIKQKPGPAPKIFKIDMPNQAKFNYKQYQLTYYSIQKTQNPKAIVIFIHGMNAHGQGAGYFLNVISHINPQINTFSYDQMNFGKSQGPYRGQIQSLQDSISQLQTFVNFILTKYNNKPKVFLSGASYGGTTAVKASIIKPQKYSGLILLAPALRNLSQASPVLKKIGKCIGFLMPRVRLFRDTFESGTKYNQVQRIQNDPYVYNDGTVPGSVRTILNSIQQVSTLFDQVQLAYIIFQAGVQKLVDPFAPLDLQQMCKSKDKTTIYCEDMWHAVLAQQEIQYISWKSAQWLKERT